MKKLVPGKPIRYVVNSHPHFDHAGGLRAAVAEGATIVTQARQRAVLRARVRAAEPRSPRPAGAVGQASASSGRSATGSTLSDGTRTVEIHHIADSRHNDSFLMVYLPKEKLLIEADAYTPGAPNAPPPATPNANNVNLIDNIERLKLAGRSILPLHGRVVPVAELYAAASATRRVERPAPDLLPTMTDSPASPRAVIADDERLLRDQLRARLGEVWPELEIVGEAKNGIEAVQLTEQLHPDLVFLDIRMPGMSGVEAARAIAQLPVAEARGDAGDAQRLAGCEIVFITAYDQYAIEAFEQGVVDYVLKPAERERLQVTVERIKKRLAQRRTDDGAPRCRPAATAAEARNADQPECGSPVEVDPGDGRPEHPDDPGRGRAVLHLRREVHAGPDRSVEALIRKPIKELVDELDADVFWQIHRSTLVNTRHIAGVTRDLRGRQLVSVKGHPEKLEVSRSYAGLFKGM